jgi:hypothetical protein
MMPRRFSEISLQRLYTCHPKLVTLFKCVLNEHDCIIICGHRNEADQNKAFDEGKSKLRWPKGQHNKVPSRAVDVMPWPLEWDNHAKLDEFAKTVKYQAECLGIKIVWGGDWTGFVDRPHWELHKEED